MSNILNSPHRPELDRLLGKIEHGEDLTDAELMFAKDWLWEIITASEQEGISKGEKSLAGDIYSNLHIMHEKNKHRLKEAHA